MSLSSYNPMSSDDQKTSIAIARAIGNGDLKEVKQILEKNPNKDINTLYLPSKDHGHVQAVLACILNILTDELKQQDPTLVSNIKEIVKYLLTEKKALPLCKGSSDSQQHILGFTTSSASLTEFLVTQCGIDVNSCVQLQLKTMPTKDFSGFLIATALSYSLLDFYLSPPKRIKIKENISKLLSPSLNADVRLALPHLLREFSRNAVNGRIVEQDLIDLFYDPIKKLLNQIKSTIPTGIGAYLKAVLYYSNPARPADKLLKIEEIDTSSEIGVRILISAVEIEFNSLFQRAEPKATKDKLEVKEQPITKEMANLYERIAVEDKKSDDLQSQLQAAQTEQNAVAEKSKIVRADSERSLKKLDKKYNKQIEKHQQSQQAFAAALVDSEQELKAAEKKLAEEYKLAAARVEEESQLQKEIERMTTLLQQKKQQKTDDDQAYAECKRLQTEIAVCEKQIAHKRKTADDKKNPSSASRIMSFIKTAEKRLPTLEAQRTQVGFESEEAQSILTERQRVSDKLIADLALKPKESELSITAETAAARLIQLEQLLKNQQNEIQRRQSQLQVRTLMFTQSQQLFQANNTVLMDREKKWASLQPAISTPVVLPPTPIAYKMREVSLFPRNMRVMQFSCTLFLLWKHLLPKLPTDQTIFFMGSMINDFLQVDGGGTATVRSKAIIDTNTTRIDLASCILIPVNELTDMRFQGDEKLDLMRIQCCNSSSSGDEKPIFIIKDRKEDISFFLQQQVVNFDCVTDDMMDFAREQAVFTKNRVLLRTNYEYYINARAELWYHDAKDLNDLMTDQLVLVEDLENKPPMLSFHMLADLLQLGSEVKITIPTSIRAWTDDLSPLRRWTEKLWCKDPNAINDKYRELKHFLLSSQHELTALKLMYQYNILEPMLLPSKPKFQVTPAEFKKMYDKIEEALLDYLPKKKKWKDTMKYSEPQGVGAIVASLRALKLNYLSEVYGILIASYYPESKNDPIINTVLEQFNPLFSTTDKNRKLDKKLILNAIHRNIPHRESKSIAPMARTSFKTVPQMGSRNVATASSRREHKRR